MVSQRTLSRRKRNSDFHLTEGEKADTSNINITNIKKISSMSETWKEIEKFPKYEVSDHGNIRNIKTKRPLRSVPHSLNSEPTIKMSGYCQRERHYVSHVVLGEFKYGGKYYLRGFKVRHRDGNVSNNNLSNLEVIPQKATLGKEKFLLYPNGETVKVE